MVSSKTISNLFLHSVTGGSDDSFVGLKTIGNEVHIFHPECYAMDNSSQEIREDILALLRTISIAKTTTSEHSKAYNTHNVDGDFALFSYIWIIKDYLAHGFYVNREKVYQINESGKINWKKTMQSDAIVSKKNIIFPNITVERKSNVDNILVEIHRYCVKKSIDYIGWLFNLNSNFIQVPKFTSSIRKMYLETIRQELDHTFIDEKKILLNHMKNVIAGLDESSNNKDFVYGVDTYYYIFERMVDSIFGNVSDISDFYPSAKWYLKKHNYKGYDSSKLRPDTVLILPNDELDQIVGNASEYSTRNNKTAFVLDSKFYRFGFTGNESDLPETSSIQKQITYGDYIRLNIASNSKDNKDIDKIYSAFILPYDKNREIFKSNDNLQYIGYAKSAWKDNSQSHDVIYTFLIDLRHVIKTWNQFNHMDDVRELAEQIMSSHKELLKA